MKKSEALLSVLQSNLSATKVKGVHAEDGQGENSKFHLPDIRYPKCPMERSNKVVIIRFSSDTLMAGGCAHVE